MFEILGPAAVPTLICLVVGLVCLVIEMLTPGIGAFGIAGLGALIAVVVMQFGWGSPTVAIYIIAIVLVLITLILIWFIRSFQRGRLSKSFLVLSDSIDSNSAAVKDTEKTELLGLEGLTITMLRPSGIAEFSGKRLDVMTSGAFIEAGKRVRITSTEGLHILVEELPA